MKKKKNLVLFLLMFILIMANINLNSASGATKTFTFAESTSQTQTQTITLPHFKSLNSITANTGNVVVKSIVADTLTLELKNGAYSRRVVTSGTPADSMFVTNQTSAYYNSGGYTGTLSSYLYSGSYTPAGPSKVITQVIGHPIHGNMELYPGDSIDLEIPYTENGITIMLEQYNFTVDSGGSSDPPGQAMMYVWYKGTWQVPAIDTRVYRYQGTVTKPDTRIYQNYYQYTVTVNYIDNTAPTLTLTEPSNNDIFSEVTGYNSIPIQGSLQDPDIGDKVTVKYTLNNASGIAVKAGSISPIITANGSNQSFNSSLLVDSSIADGTYTLKVWAEDDKDGISEVISRTIVIDKISPNTPTIIVTPTPWGNTSVSFNIGGSTDSVSGIGKYQYQIDSGEWADFDEDVFIEDEGIHEINARAVDNVGNVSAIATEYARLDNTPPVIGNGLDPSVRYTNAVDGTLMRFSMTNGTDAGGSEYEGTYFWCRKNSEPWFLEEQRGIWDTNKWYIDVEINGEGRYLTRAYPHDNADNWNWSSYVDEQYIVDRQAPNAPTIMLSRSGVGNTDVSLYLINNGDNGIAGIDYMQIQTDGGTWINYTGEYVNDTEGTHTVTARAIDKAGNVSAISTTAFQMETTSPILNLSLNTTDPDTGPVTIIAKATDNESGVNRIELPSGAIMFTSTATYSVSRNGIYTFYAYDNAGNEAIRSISVTNIITNSIPSSGSAAIFDSAEEAAKDGYYPDPKHHN